MEKKSSITRREFLSRSAAAAAVGSHVASGKARASTANQPPFVTGVPGKKLVGCYMYSLDDILDQKYMDALQKKLGVNVILFSPSIKLPEWLLEINPLGEKRILCARAHTDDDSGVYKAVEEAHRRGMDFWLYYTGHHYGEESRPIISETFDGVKFLDLPRIRYSLENMRTACFSKPIVKEFEPAVFSYGAKTYGADSMYVSHYRYTNPSFWPNLFGCACRYCQEEAEQMGYDFNGMKKAMKNLRRRLGRLDRKTVEYAAKSRMTFTDFLTFMGEDDGVMDWIVFRAKVVGNQLKRINSAVHTATNNRCGFITDTHNPTLSILVGHNYADFFDGASDAFHTLSWCGSQHIGAVAAWANQLCEWVPGLDESVALRLVTGFFGWDELGLPDKRIHEVLGMKSPDDRFSREAMYDIFNPDITINLMTHEWTKLAAINRGRLPAHPVIKGDSWPEKVGRELMERADSLGLTGYVFQRTDVFIDREKL